VHQLRIDDDRRRELFGALLEQVAVLEEKTGRRIELFPKPRPEVGREQGPVTVYLTSFDLSNPDDFERMYQMFLTGSLPEAPPKGPLRFLRNALSWGGSAIEDREPPPPVRQSQRKVGRNAPCPCGSGRKYKACCGR
jgi:SEC-C motif